MTIHDQPVMPRSSGTLTVLLPAEPPRLTPSAARELLRLLILIHNTSADACQDELPWGRTA